MASKKVTVRGIAALKGSPSRGKTIARTRPRTPPKKKPVAPKRRTSPTRATQSIGAPRKPAAAKSDRKTPTAKSVQAVVARAEKARTKVRAQAKKDVALIKKLLERVKRDFYEIGLALARLEPGPVYGTLEYSTFGDLVRDEFGMSEGWARQLVTVVTEVSREDAQALGVSKAVALVKLCQVTDARNAADLARARVPLPSGNVLDVATASVRAVKAATKELRRARQPRGKPLVGLTTSPAERARVRTWNAAMRKVVPTARVIAVPTAPGAEAEVRVEGVPLSEIQAFCAVFCK